MEDRLPAARPAPPGGQPIRGRRPERKSAA